jgi:hypothetical protein
VFIRSWRDTAYSKNEKDEKRIKILAGKLNGRDHLGDLSVNGKVTLRLNLRK